MAKATHAGIPWILFLRKELGGKVHFWPFDGFAIPEGKSAMVEIHPSLVRKRYPVPAGFTEYERDAYGAARWLQEIDRQEQLSRYLLPHLTDEEQLTVFLEGRILGVD